MQITITQRGRCNAYKKQEHVTLTSVFFPREMYENIYNTYGKITRKQVTSREGITVPSLLGKNLLPKKINQFLFT